VQRVLTPEWLDELPPQDAQAIGSRADLRRLNAWMSHVSVLARELRGHQPKRVIDLGCGDGSFALRLARALRWRGVELVLVDRAPALAPFVQEAFASMGVTATFCNLDVTQGLAALGSADLILTNLFLHHFDDRTLRSLLQDVAGRTSFFIAAEPRRAALALWASRCVGLIGCNAVTRHDAVASVRAGFNAEELSELWPNNGWRVKERRAGLFSHLFTAARV
jgi:SAM-dependent methyltransferase